MNNEQSIMRANTESENYLKLQLLPDTREINELSFGHLAEDTEEEEEICSQEFNYFLERISDEQENEEIYSVGLNDEESSTEETKRKAVPRNQTKNEKTRKTLPKSRRLLSGNHDTT